MNRRRKLTLKRKRAKIEGRKIILIVTEGSKTEPMYFNDMKRHLRVSSAHIEIYGDGPTDPLGLIRYAIDKFEQDPIYDSVFCIFDRDTHIGFNDAIEMTREKRLIKRSDGDRKRIKIECIVSNPCFEYWLLLHFRQHRAPFGQAGSSNSSPCRDVIRKLKQHLPNYSKGKMRVYAETESLLNDAVRNSHWALRDANSTGRDNPSTLVHILIEKIQSLM